MGFGSCDCEDTLVSIPRNECAFDIGQIIRIGASRIQSTPHFPGLAEIENEDEWQALLDADDDTKIVLTPIIENLTIPPSTAILEGGDDNSTLDGQPIALGGSSPRSETGMMSSLQAAVRVALKKIQCVQSMDNPVILYFFTAKGKIISQAATSGPSYEGMPCAGFFIGDPSIDGYNTRDKTPIGFSFAYGWADRLREITPDFNVRTLFATAS